MKRTVSILAVFLALSIGAKAEDFFAVKKKSIEEALFRLGFIYVSPALTIENTGYNSNIYQYDEDVEPDYTADVGLRLKLAALITRRFILVVEEHPFYSFYLENKQEEAWSNRLDASLYTYLGPFNITLSGARNDLRQRPTSEFGRRVRSKNRREGVSIDMGRHSGLFVNLYYDQMETDFSSADSGGEWDLAELLNTREKRYGLKINMGIFARTRLYLHLGVFETRFPELPERDGDHRQASLGVRFPEIGRVSGEVEIGYRFSDPKNPAYPAYDSLFGTGDFSIRLLRRLRLDIRYSLDNYYSFYSPDLYYFERGFSGTLGYYLSRRVKLGVRHRRSVLSYRSLESGDRLRDDRLQQSEAFLEVKLFRNAAMGLAYTQFTVQSDLVDLERSYNFIGGYLSYDF